MKDKNPKKRKDKISKKMKGETTKKVQPTTSTRRLMKLHYFWQQYQTFKTLLMKKHWFAILKRLSILIRREWTYYMWQSFTVILKYIVAKSELLARSLLSAIDKKGNSLLHMVGLKRKSQASEKMQSLAFQLQKELLFKVHFYLSINDNHKHCAHAYTCGKSFDY